MYAESEVTISFSRTNYINSHILPEFTTVTFQLLDDCVEQLVVLGKGAFIAKADLQDAFHIIPVSPLDNRLLDFKFQGLRYFDMCLPMACSNLCQTFEILSQALEWISHNKYQVSSMSHILDDFIFVLAKTLSECHFNLSRFLELHRMVTLPIKQYKTVLPSTTVTRHSIEVDTLNQTLTLIMNNVTSLRQKLIGKAKR